MTLDYYFINKSHIMYIMPCFDDGNSTKLQDKQSCKQKKKQFSFIVFVILSFVLQWNQVTVRLLQPRPPKAFFPLFFKLTNSVRAFKQ